MPYIHCPQCRLTVYSAARYSTREGCPRCDASLVGAPRSLFPLRPEPGLEGSTPADGTAALIQRALVSTGVFRDREARAR